MTRTIRVYWGQRTTGWFNFNWAGVIDRQSVIHISASEGSLSGGLGSTLDGIGRFRGAAVIGVRNVTPHIDSGGGGGVEFYLETGWETPINVVTDITVMDPVEDAVIV